MAKENNNGKPKGISATELNRRWTNARDAMKEAGLDFLLIENSSNYFPGHVRWFTDLSVNDGDPTTLIFPLSGEMTIMTFGDTNWGEKGPNTQLPGIKRHFGFPELHNLKDAGLLNAEKVVELLKPYKNCHIGLVGMGLISAAFYQYVTTHLTSAKFTDATDLVDSLKVVKSDEEIGLIREATHIQDQLFEYALTCLKPGRRNYDAVLDIRHRAEEIGARNDMIMVGSAPPGTAAMIGMDLYRVIEDGDQCIILFENDSADGYWAEMARIICLGRVSSELEEQFGLAQQAQKISLDMMKPGVIPADMYRANNQFLRSHGYPEQNFLYGHGQGLDIAERPGLDAYETFRIKGRMDIAVHPMIMSKAAVGWVCEDYLISEDGKYECLQKTPQKIFRM